MALEKVLGLAASGITERTIDTSDSTKLPLAGGTLTGALVINASTVPSGNVIRIKSDAYGVFWKFDSSNLWLMSTNENDPDGSFNNNRPFTYNYVSNKVTISSELAIAGFTTFTTTAQFNGNLFCTRVNSPSIEVGITASQNAVVDFHSGAALIDYDARIWAAAGDGDGTVGNGKLRYVAIGGHYFTGLIQSSNNISAFSDRKLKKNLKRITYPLEKVRQISGWSYDRRDIKSPRQVGLIANEVQKICPELVTVTEDGTLALDYSGTIAILVEAIKRLDKQVTQLSKKKLKATKKKKRAL